MATLEGMPDASTLSSPERAYIKLSAIQLARANRYGVSRSYESAKQLFRQGERAADFYIVLAGSIQIFWCDVVARTEPYITLEPGEFTGELNLLNQKETLVGARATAGSTVLGIRRERLREFLIGEPEIGELIIKTIVLRRKWMMQIRAGGLTLLGHADSGPVEKLARFLNANAYPYRLADPAQCSAVQSLMVEKGLQESDLPAVLSAKWMLKRPELPALAQKLGLADDVREGITWDLLVVGAGPAGLATAVYAASEGLRTLVLDSYAPGGQAGTSSKIENYLGFSTGISGAELAKQAQVQAEKFGATVAVCRTVTGIDCTVEPFSIELDGNRIVSARAVVIATGARYRTLNIDGMERFAASIHYAATPIDVQPCIGQPVVIVGGGNSAGQAAMYLSTQASHVHMLIRGPQLSATMSDYLVQRIYASKEITLHPCSEVVELEGDDRLSHVTWARVRPPGLPPGTCS
jgi:thioredoxin reductase (NADPH)